MAAANRPDDQYLTGYAAAVLNLREVGPGVHFYF